MQGGGECDVGMGVDCCMLFEGDCHGILSSSHAVVCGSAFGALEVA